MTQLAAHAKNLFQVPPAMLAENPAAELRLESVAYLHAQVALFAKLAAVDGAVNKAEFSCFSELVSPTESFDALRMRSLFAKHVNDSTSALQYARQIVAIVGYPTAKLTELLQQLVQLAGVDAPVNAAEMELLGAIAGVFALDRELVKALLSSQTDAPRTPHAVLGVAVDATPEQVRARYMSLVQTLHPDRFQAEGASADTMALLSDQLAELNAAYDAIKRHHQKRSANVAGRWWRSRNAKGAKA